LAIFNFRQNGIVVSEAGVPATSLIQAGRIYVEVSTAVNTGIAIANPNNQPAQVSFNFTDILGNDFGPGSTVLPPNGQIARFLDQAPFNAGASLNGAFTFRSNVPIAVVGIRGLTNERSEFLLTTLPVTDLNASAASSGVFPHFADGAGWTSQVILVNPGDTALTGTLQFMNQSGAAAPLSVNGQQGSSFSYALPPRTIRKFVTSGVPVVNVSGSVRLLPAGSGPAPHGLVVFSYRNGGVTVSEAGVAMIPGGRAFRLFAEAAGKPEASGFVQTGIAVANTSPAAVTVSLELFSLDGSPSGLTGTISVPPDGQTAAFLHQIPGFTSLVAPFRGTLRVSGNATIAVSGIRGRYNERGDFLLTITPAIDEEGMPPAAFYFPHIVDGQGYTTEFILFASQPGRSTSGTLRLFSQYGGAWNATVQ
jgi:hypothetical protein